MKCVAVLLMLLGNRELNRGLCLPQVVHGSVLPGPVLLLPPPPPPPVAVAVSPPLEELRCADDAVAQATVPPVEPPRKRGRLHGEDATRHQHLIKELVVKLVNDVQFRSTYKFCKEESSLALRSSLDRMMKRDPALIKVMEERNRGNPVLVQAAVLALERLVPPRDGVEASRSL